MWSPTQQKWGLRPSLMADGVVCCCFLVVLVLNIRVKWGGCQYSADSCALQGVVGHSVDSCWSVVGQLLVGGWWIIELDESQFFYCLDWLLAAAICICSSWCAAAAVGELQEAISMPRFRWLDQWSWWNSGGGGWYQWLMFHIRILRWWQCCWGWERESPWRASSKRLFFRFLGRFLL